MVSRTTSDGPGLPSSTDPFAAEPAVPAPAGPGSARLDPTGLALTVESPSSPDAQALIAALDADLARTYPRDVIFGLHEEDHDPAHMVFLVGRLGGRAVACGALRSLDPGTGEVKRMYVVPGLRRRGLSRIVLAEVEAHARRRGHRRLRLETGNLSPASLGLYRSSGFHEIPAWGEYAGNAYSVCFEKDLSGAA